MYRSVNQTVILMFRVHKVYLWQKGPVSFVTKHSAKRTSFCSRPYIKVFCTSLPFVASKVNYAKLLDWEGRISDVRERECHKRWSNQLNPHGPPPTHGHTLINVIRIIKTITSKGELKVAFLYIFILEFLSVTLKTESPHF